MSSNDSKSQTNPVLTKLLGFIRKGDVSGVETTLKQHDWTELTTQDLTSTGTHSGVLHEVVSFTGSYNNSLDFPTRSANGSITAAQANCDPSPDLIGARMMTALLADDRVDQALFDMDANDNSRESILSRCASRRYTAIVKLLLADRRMSDAMIRKPNLFGSTPLLLAALESFSSRKGHVPTVEALLADPRVDETVIDCTFNSWKSYYGSRWTALTAAAHDGDAVMVETLLLANCNVAHITLHDWDYQWDLRDYRRTALMFAADKGHVAVMKVLLACDRVTTEVLSVADKDGVTALLLAVRRGHVDIVKLLLADDRVTTAVLSIADKDDGATALSLAVRCGHVDIVKLLLADDRVDCTIVHHADNNDNTVLQLVLRYLDMPCMLTLLLSTSKMPFGTIVEELREFQWFFRDRAGYKDIMLDELTRRQMIAIYPPSDRLQWPQRLTMSDTVPHSESDVDGKSDADGKSDRGNVIDIVSGCGLVDSLFSSKLFDVQVLGIIREYVPVRYAEEFYDDFDYNDDFDY
jgi:ankyrin repeat protein